MSATGEVIQGVADAIGMAGLAAGSVKREADDQIRRELDDEEDKD